jgi:membrane-bound inhibitor of C-type lysozyme
MQVKTHTNNYDCQKRKLDISEINSEISPDFNYVNSYIKLDS